MRQKHQFLIATLRDGSKAASSGRKDRVWLTVGYAMGQRMLRVERLTPNCKRLWVYLF